MMKTAFQGLRIIGTQRYANNVSMAQNIMQTAFRWLKTLREQRFDGSTQDVNNVSMAQNIM